MIRRPLWNRGGGVFVEEASWQVPVERRPAADQPAPASPPPEVRSAPPADRPAPLGRSRAEARPAARKPRVDNRRESFAGPRADASLRPGPRRPAWLGVLTVREDD